MPFLHIFSGLLLFALLHRFVFTFCYCLLYISLQQVYCQNYFFYFVFCVYDLHCLVLSLHCLHQVAHMHFMWRGHSLVLSPVFSVSVIVVVVWSTMVLEERCFISLCTVSHIYMFTLPKSLSKVTGLFFV